MPGIWSRIVLSIGVAEEQDLTVVSMKNDWSTVFAEPTA
jgi:hypothetical protein